MIAPKILFALFPRVTAHHNKFGRALVLAGLGAPGRLAPRRHRVTPAAGTTAKRMIDRIHRLAADMAAPPEPAVTPRLADRDVHVVRVGHRADRGDALAVYQALLA